MSSVREDAVRNLGLPVPPQSARGDRFIARWTAPVRMIPLVLCLVSSALGPGCAILRGNSLTSSARAQRVLEEALAARERRDLERAEQLLTEAVRNNPENAEIRWELAKVLLDRRKFDQAAPHLEYLVEQNPEDARGYVRLAQMLFDRERYAEADRLIELALERDPYCPDALILSGRLDEVHGQESRALESYHRILLSDPEYVDAILRIAAIQLKQGKPEQAGQLLRSAQESTRASALERRQLFWLLGTAYARKGRWADASTALAAGVDLQHPTADQLYKLAYTRYRAGDVAGSRRDLAAALALDPQHQFASVLRQHLQSLPSSDRVSQPIMQAEHVE